MRCSLGYRTAQRGAHLSGMPTHGCALPKGALAMGYCCLCHSVAWAPLSGLAAMCLAVNEGVSKLTNHGKMPMIVGTCLWHVDGYTPGAQQHAKGMSLQTAVPLALAEVVHLLLLSWADAWAVCQCALVGVVTVFAFGGGGGGPPGRGWMGACGADTCLVLSNMPKACPYRRPGMGYLG